MDINAFAVKVTQLEGKKKSVDIAQVKEVLAVTRKLIKGMSGVDIYAIIKNSK